MMDPRRVDRSLDIHIVIDNVDNALRNGRYDPRTSAGTEGKPQRAVLSQYDRRRHRRKRTFTRLDRIAFTLYQPEHIRLARSSGKIVHLIIEQHAGPLGSHSRTIEVVYCLGIRDLGSLRIDDGVMRRFHRLTADNLAVTDILAA